MAYKPATWEDKFLRLYRETGNVTLSARGAGINRNTVYERRKNNPAFAAIMDDAREEAIEILEAVANKRARESSDTLLIFLLKSLKPDTYGDKLRISYDAETIAQLKRFEEKLKQRGTTLQEALPRMEAALDKPIH